MSHNWGPDNSSLPGKGNVWLITLAIVSLLIGFGWGWRCWQTDYTSIQHRYWNDYRATDNAKYQIKSPLSREREYSYEITCWVGLQTDCPSGAVTLQNEFPSESERLHKHLHQEDRRYSKTPTVMHEWLKEDIYEGISPLEIEKGLLHDGSVAALLTFFSLLCFALIADLKRADVRKNGQRRRGAQFTTTRQFNRGTK